MPGFEFWLFEERDAGDGEWLKLRVGVFECWVRVKYMV